MQLARLLGLLVLPAVGLACPGLDHEHGLSKRSSRYSTQPVSSTDLLRPLVWGDLNVLSTTDIHGWYQGHMK